MGTERGLNVVMRLILQRLHHPVKSQQEPQATTTTGGWYHENNLKCHTCGKSFTYKRNLQRHISSVHNGVGSQNCDYCTKKPSINWKARSYIDMVDFKENPVSMSMLLPTLLRDISVEDFLKSATSWELIYQLLQFRVIAKIMKGLCLIQQRSLKKQ